MGERGGVGAIFLLTITSRSSNEYHYSVTTLHIETPQCISDQDLPFTRPPSPVEYVVNENPNNVCYYVILRGSICDGCDEFACIYYF